MTNELLSIAFSKSIDQHKELHLFRYLFVLTLSLLAGFKLLIASEALAIQDLPTLQSQRIGFIGLHGGIYEELEKYAELAEVQLRYLDESDLERADLQLENLDLLLIQHFDVAQRSVVEQAVLAVLKTNPNFKVIDVSGLVAGKLPQLEARDVLISDEQVSAYYGNSSENLRRLLLYLGKTYLGRETKILPPEIVEELSGLFHPDHKDMFASTEEFLNWSSQQNGSNSRRWKVVVAVHSTHLQFQQPLVVEALLRECEKQGAMAVAMVDGSPGYEKNIRTFAPDVVIHTCHSRETINFRKELDVPHLHAIFFRKQSIEQWETTRQSLAANEIAFQITGQELLGAIEPQIAAGTHQGNGSEEAFTPIPERIEHLVSRASAWAKLRKVAHADKKIAFVYYDREMGKSELMRGSATGMFLNGPRSLLAVLERMEQAGYNVRGMPRSEADLLNRMKDHGRQIGIWAGESLDELARSGKAVLLPANTYKQWLGELPESLQQEMISKWGESPGKFGVWNHNSQQFLVIPRIEVGNSILLPQPLRGEAQDPSVFHDVRVPPSHHYLATYLWLQKEYRANALVHFGTHGSEFLLPGKPLGLGKNDWSDVILGDLPNINPWVINNLGESSPARRRAYAVLIDHQTPPSESAGLSDELKNLHEDIDKWYSLETGALKNRFASSITQQVYQQNLQTELDFPVAASTLDDDQIMSVLSYLHDIHNETTPTSLHILGQAPQGEQLYQYLAVCLGQRFLDSLTRHFEVPEIEALTEGDRRKYLHTRALDFIRNFVGKDLNFSDAMVAAGGRLNSVPDPTIDESILRLQQLAAGFEKSDEEITNLLDSMDGRFIAPGPGNSPDRNAGVLPTGRNMYVMNPEEVPARASWELATELIDQLLKQKLEESGRYPNRVAFTLNSFATFQDYGIMESQILYLMGVKPKWDRNNQVIDLEVIPSDELGRPRIDVFIAGLSYYRDMLPSRMKLLDKAVQQINKLGDEPFANQIRENSQRVFQNLKQKGLNEEIARKYSQGRIFGYPEGQMGSAGYYYMVEKSGVWNNSNDLMQVYLSHVRNIYTQDLWGVAAAEAYNEQIQGTEIVMRSWSDRTRSPSSNKYDWYHGGSLCKAVEHLTGSSPEFLFTDVRAPDQSAIVSADMAFRKDLRVRIFNRKWIEGMMREGYAGADQVAVHVGNAFGWSVMREDSMDDALWNEIVEVYLHDKKNLAIREWFEKENPHAFEEVHEVLLEAARKGYWKAEPQLISEIANDYVRLVMEHGRNEGLRSGGNQSLVDFVSLQAGRFATAEQRSRLQQWQINGQSPSVAVNRVTPSANTASNVTETVAAPDREVSPTQENQDASSFATEQRSGEVALESVSGLRISETVEEETTEKPSEPVPGAADPNSRSVPTWLSLAALSLILLIAIGFARGSGKGGY